MWFVCSIELGTYETLQLSKGPSLSSFLTRFPFQVENKDFPRQLEKAVGRFEPFDAWRVGRKWPQAGMNSKLTMVPNDGLDKKRRIRFF